MKRWIPVIRWPWYLRLVTVPFLLLGVVGMMVEAAVTGLVMTFGVIMGDLDE